MSVEKIESEGVPATDAEKAYAWLAAQRTADVARISDLESKVARLQNAQATTGEALDEMEQAYITATMRAEQAERDLAAARQDAERYRWLRDARGTGLNIMLHGNGCVHLTADELDAAIDASRQGETR